MLGALFPFACLSTRYWVPHQYLLLRDSFYNGNRIKFKKTLKRQMWAIGVMFTSSFMQILKYLTLSKLNWHCCLYLAFSKNEWLSRYSDFIKWLQKVFLGSMYHQTFVCGGERGIILQPRTCQTSGEHTCTTQNDLGCKTFIIHASLYTLII